MDFFQSVKQLLFVLLVVITLYGCSETKSAETPVILGTPSDSAIVDVLYEYEFGADGGDGLLSYSIISGPDWLQIENLNGAKPAFRIFGVPTVGDRAAFDEFTKENIDIVLGVTDGGRSSSETYEIVLEKNTIEFDENTWDVLEGATTPALEQANFSDDCELPSMDPYLEGGKIVYPFPVTLTLDAPAETDITLHYIMTSKYDDSFDERDASNLRLAKPDVDYLVQEGFFVMKAGVTKCAFAISLFDDDILEGSERFTLTFDELLTGWAIFSQNSSVDIADSEPTVTFNSEVTTMTMGDARVFSFTLSDKVDYPISMTVYVDNESNSPITTADYDLSIGGVSCNASYIFADNTCVITFPPNTEKGEFEITVKDDLVFTELDETLIVTSPVVSIYNLDRLEISINEWITDVTVTSSIGGGGSIAKDMVIDTEGNVITLLQSLGLDSDVSVTLNQRNGSTSLKFLAGGDALLASADSKAEVAGGMSYRRSGTHYVGVALTTSGSFTGFPNPDNDKDVVVQLYSRLDGALNYSDKWIKQFGTDQDDVANGVKVDSGGNSWVFGYTEGTFTGADANPGGRDGFIRKFDILGNLLWTRQVGSNGDDEIVGVEFISRGIYAIGVTSGVMGEGSSGGQDGFLLTLTNDGVVSNTVQFGTGEDDFVTGVEATRTELLLSGHSRGDVEVSSDGLVGTSALNSVDPFFLVFDESGNISRSLQFGDATQDDVSSGISTLATSAYLGATTPGEYETGAHLGGSDAVISRIDNDDEESAVAWHKQFGTAEEDSLISVEVYSTNKVFGLWETDDSAGNITYKISPFSVEGVKLTP